MAIRPHYAEAILSGRKQVEFRKRPVAADVKTVAIYATAPVSKIIGEFTVAAVDVAPPTELWSRLQDIGEIEEPDFNAYYAGSASGAGIRVATFRRYSSPVSLEDVEPRLPVPQSFMYLTSDAAAQLRALAAPAGSMVARLTRTMDRAVRRLVTGESVVQEHARAVHTTSGDREVALHG